MLLNDNMQIAQGITNPAIGNLQGMIGQGGAGYFGSLISVVVTIIIAVGGLYFVFQLLTGGVAWIGSGGDKAALEQARSKLFHAGIGLVLLFSAWAIIKLVEGVFGVSIFLFQIPTVSFGLPPTGSGPF